MSAGRLEVLEGGICQVCKQGELFDDVLRFGEGVMRAPRVVAELLRGEESGG